MRSVILTGCLWMLSLAVHAQNTNTRIPSGTPLSFGGGGRLQVMPGELAHYYASPDTSTAHMRNRSQFNTVIGGNPTATRFASVKALCDQNSLVLNWVAVQQFGADRYQVEQSEDAGRTWRVIGEVPANRTEYGESNYRFNYNKNVRSGLFRVTATSNGGDRVASIALESPCSNNAYLAATPNPVYSTTNVRIGSPATAKVRLILVDAKGAALQSWDEGLMQGINDISVDMSRLPRGHYTLVISWSKGKQETIALVKQ